MSRTELRCDAARRVTARDVAVSDVVAEAGLQQKCGKLLARSPTLGEMVQWLTPEECEGDVWLIDHHRHIAGVHVRRKDGIETGGLGGPAEEDQVVAWTALRPCNGEPLR